MWPYPDVPRQPDAAEGLTPQQVHRLLQRLGRPGRDAVAEELLAWLAPQVALAQCAIFSFERPSRPHIVAMGDRSRTSALPDIAHAYVTRYVRLDPAWAAMQAEEAQAREQARAPRMFIQRQRPADISHAGYRHTCYGLPQVAERVAILAWYDNRYWMSINLYRGEEHGALNEAHLARIDALAPAMVEAVRLHHTGRQLEQDLPELMLSRLSRRFPGLTPRDQDVLRALLQGQDNPTLAAGLGLTLSSAQTYVKRTFRKLGIASQRELLALLMAPE